MTEFKEGDYVRYTKVVEGKLLSGSNTTANLLFPEGNTDVPYTKFAEQDGWVVEKIAPPAPPFPTEPGVYVIDVPEDAPNSYTLAKNGTWWYGARENPLYKMQDLHKKYNLRKVA